MGKSTKSINKENIQNKLKKLKIFAKMKRIVLTFVIFLIASSYSNPLPSGPGSSDIGILNEEGIEEEGELKGNEEGIVAQVVNGLTKGVQMSEINLKKIRGFLEKIDNMVNKVNRKISDIITAMGTISTKKYKEASQASKTYRYVRAILRRTRQELFKLADKTRLVTDDVLVYLEGWGPDHPVKDKKIYFKIQMKLLEDLIDESKTVLEDAEIKYKRAANEIDEVDGHLSVFLQDIRKVLDNTTIEHAEMEHRLRAGYYTGGGVALAGTILADIFGCLGICSAIAGSTIAAGSAGLEVTIYAAEVELEKLEKVVSQSDSAIRDLKNGDIMILLNFIQLETGAIQKWQNAIEHLDEKMEYAKDEEFFKLSIYRKSFGNAVRSLKVAATKFNERPKEIFGNDRKIQKMT